MLLRFDFFISICYFSLIFFLNSKTYLFFTLESKFRILGNLRGNANFSYIVRAKYLINCTVLPVTRGFENALKENSAC